MRGIDLDRLLAEISPDAPSGEKDPESDPAFIELNIKLEGTPERFDGTSEHEAIGPTGLRFEMQLLNC